MLGTPIREAVDKKGTALAAQLKEDTDLSIHSHLALFEKEKFVELMRENQVDVLNDLLYPNPEEFEQQHNRLTAVEELQETYDKTLSTLNSRLEQKLNATDQTVNLLLGYKGDAEDKMTKMTEEIASLRTLLSTLFDDVKKGEISGGKGSKESSKMLRTEEVEMITETPAPTQPRPTTPPRPDPTLIGTEQPAQPASHTPMDKGKKPIDEGDQIAELLLFGVSMDQACDPLFRAQFYKEQAERERKLAAQEAKEKSFQTPFSSPSSTERSQQQSSASTTQSKKKKKKSFSWNLSLKKQTPTDAWVPEGDQSDWEKVKQGFILNRYFLKEPTYSESTPDEDFIRYLENFKDQDLIQRVRKAAADAKIKFKAPEKEFMVCPTIPGSNLPDKTYILSYINQLAKIKGYKIDNHDPNYARIRDGIYESIQLVSDAQREKMKKGGAARWFS